MTEYITSWTDTFCGVINHFTTDGIIPLLWPAEITDLSQAADCFHFETPHAVE